MSSSDFGAKLILHLVYKDAESAKVAGHIVNGYANVDIPVKAYFESKEAFMGLICKAFERFYEEMKVGRQNQGVSEKDTSRAEGQRGSNQSP